PFSCTTLFRSRRLAPALIGQLLDPATHRRRANPKRLASLGDAHALIEHLARGLDFELRRKISSAHLIPRSGWCSNPNRVSEIIEPLHAREGRPSLAGGRTRRKLGNKSARLKRIPHVGNHPWKWNIPSRWQRNPQVFGQHGGPPRVHSPRGERRPAGFWANEGRTGIERGSHAGRPNLAAAVPADMVAAAPHARIPHVGNVTRRTRKIRSRWRHTAQCSSARSCPNFCGES